MGILRSTERMTRITSDLLDASKIEMGHFSILPEAGDVNRLIAETLDSFRDASEAKKIKLDAQFSAPSLWVKLDHSRFTQAISNLIHNAIKLSPQGGVMQITAKETDGFLRVAVSDQGPGISPENMQCIFDRYWTEKSRSSHGTGLGLFIAKGIARSHGGDLTVANNKDGGATFTLTIPMVREKSILVA